MTVYIAIECVGSEEVAKVMAADLEAQGFDVATVDQYSHPGYQAQYTYNEEAQEAVQAAFERACW